MHTGKGQVVELILENGLHLARIACTANLIPSPGQYLLSSSASALDSLPVSLFSTESMLQGFIACAPIPETWTPGTGITLRGPLGHGFDLPGNARKVALVPFDVSPVRLRGLIKSALRQAAAIALVCDSDAGSLPDDVEVQPFSALDEVLAWADYIAFDILRDDLPMLRERLGGMKQVSVKADAQVLVYTPVPCGGVADCGACAVNLKYGWKMACKDGPVFDLREIL